MASEWRETTLGEVTDFISGGTPSKDRPDYWAGPIPWVSAKDMKRFRLDDTEDHVSEECVANGSKLVPAGSVLLLARGMTLLNDIPICVINRPMTFNQDVKALLPKSLLRNDYLPYLLLGNKERLLSLVDLAGHGTGRLNSDELKALDVTLPSPHEQRAITHILGTLDDKIELNRKMNETLEAMVRALFKSWFMDFDPVRAKAEGRDPGLPKHIADLFPDSFEDSELGEIPRGWEMGMLGDVAEHPRRGIEPHSITPDTPYIALEHMPKQCIALSDWGVADGLESNKFEFKKGEILFGKLRPYFHKVGVAPIDGVCSTDIVVVAPKNPFWFGFILGKVSSEEFVEYTNAGSTGTKMPRTSWADMARYAIVLPPKTIAEAFTERLQPAIDRIIAGIHEAHTLATLRDTLLPKLISGELKVTNAGRFAKAAT